MLPLDCELQQTLISFGQVPVTTMRKVIHTVGFASSWKFWDLWKNSQDLSRQLWHMHSLLTRVCSLCGGPFTVNGRRKAFFGKDTRGGVCIWKLWKKHTNVHLCLQTRNRTRSCTACLCLLSIVRAVLRSWTHWYWCTHWSYGSSISRVATNHVNSRVHFLNSRPFWRQRSGHKTLTRKPLSPKRFKSCIGSCDNRRAPEVEWTWLPAEFNQRDQQ